mgnify:CR=1 FL=1
MKYEQTAVGDKYVYENMMKNGFVLGGEQSGHIIFSKHARTGDGILTSLMLMEVIMEKKQSLGKLCSEVKIYPQLLQNVRVTDKKTTLENEAVQNAIKAAAEALGSDGRILVRESGTEPVIRVMVEAATDEICTEYVNQVVNVMKDRDVFRNKNKKAESCTKYGARFCLFIGFQSRVRVLSHLLHKFRKSHSFRKLFPGFYRYIAAAPVH